MIGVYRKILSQSSCSVTFEVYFKSVLCRIWDTVQFDSLTVQIQVTGGQSVTDAIHPITIHCTINMILILKKKSIVGHSSTNTDATNDYCTH